MIHNLKIILHIKPCMDQLKMSYWWCCTEIMEICVLFLAVLQFLWHQQLILIKKKHNK